MASVTFRRILNVSSNRIFSDVMQSRNAVTTAAGSFLQAPLKQRYGLLGVALTITTGLTVGSLISRDVASFLEENDLFVPSDDDDD